MRSLLIVAFGVGGVPSLAFADEPVAANETRLLSETAEVTSVVDAFDKDDPFDFHLSVGLSQRWKRADIRRETELNQPGLSTGGFVAQTENVAKYSQNQTLLNLGAAIGIFRDLALVIRLPVILSDSRELNDLNGSSRNPQRLTDPTGDVLFGVPFKSPNRSGVDYIAAGLDYAIFNQQRDLSKPTWVVGIEGRLAIGTPLHACRDTAPLPSVPGQPNPARCPDPSNRAQDRDPGMSRGVNAVYAHTTFSRRFGYVEPYTGVSILAEFPNASTDFGQSTDLDGTLLNRPPIVGTITMGMEVIPWERKEAFQRLVIDFRVNGAYHSPGRDYSELFDALGTSSARTLTTANPGSYHQGVVQVNGQSTNGSVADPTSKQVHFTGITDQQAYDQFGGLAQATWQASEYVKLNLGLGLSFVQSHLITAADACNPNFSNNPDTAGPCKSSGRNSSITGIPNPNHRPVIDLPGRRFSADNTSLVDLWLSGVVMF